MDIRFICVGTRLPRWVQEGYRDYARRIPGECALKLVEIAPGRRGKGLDTARAVREEGDRMLRAIPRTSRVVALDVGGKAWTTEQLAEQLAGWMRDGRDLSLLVGGPDGLAEECLGRAHQRWSLSLLTLPHALVRVVVAEQIYRAWSLLRGHPYHRG